MKPNLHVVDAADPVPRKRWPWSWRPSRRLVGVVIALAGVIGGIAWIASIDQASRNIAIMVITGAGLFLAIGAIRNAICRASIPDGATVVHHVHHRRPW